MYKKGIFTEDTCKSLVKYAETDDLIKRSWWIPREELLQHEPSSFLHRTIQELYDRYMSDVIPGVVGVELWSHSYTADRSRVHWHFDKDECMWAEKNMIINPYVSSIIYLSGDNTDIQGPTCIQHLYPYQSGEIAPRSAFVYPHRGSYFTFDGRLYHSVLDSNSTTQRITLLINWWHIQPFDVPHYLPKQYQSVDVQGHDHDGKIIYAVKGGKGSEVEGSEVVQVVGIPSDAEIGQLLNTKKEMGILVVDHPGYEFRAVDIDYVHNAMSLYGEWHRQHDHPSCV